jgi:hypothetical protein
MADLRTSALPAAGSTSWYTHYSALDTELRARNGTAWLDTFAGASDDAKLTAAMSYAAAQTQPPTIGLGPRDHNFTTTGRNVYSGFALAGASDAGLQAVEQSTKGAKTRATFTGGTAASSMFNAIGPGNVYNPITCTNISWFAGNTTSQWLNAELTNVNLYGPTFGNLQFRNFQHCIGRPGQGATMTLATFWGAWNIPNMTGTPITLRGSDNWFVPDEMNIGWNAGPAGQYLMRFENCQKTFVRGLYLTARLGATRAILVDNTFNNPDGSGQTQGGLHISNSVIEGQNLGEPCAGALIYVNGHGVVSFNNICLNFAMGNPSAQSPADTAYIMCQLDAYGQVSCSDFYITRATGVAESVPILRATGGKVSVRNFWGMPGNGSGQLWTQLPLVQNAGASVFLTDGSVRTS